jgi:hypothetical protein
MLVAARDDEDRGLTDEDLLDQLLTLLVAGHETTATALAWCFERLVHHPAALARLRDEVRGGDGSAYLDAVVDETLRSPPGPRPGPAQAGRTLRGRRARDPGRHGPRGVDHRRAALGRLRRPDAFRPERFLDAPVAPSALIPFGGGARRCLGASFALMEMKTILRTALERVDLQPARGRGERPVRGRRFTTIPARGRADRRQLVVVDVGHVDVAQHVLVEQRRGDRAEHRGDQVEQQVAELAADDGRPDRPGGVERRAGDGMSARWPTTIVKPMARPADGPLGAVVDRGALDHEHEHEAEDELGDERLAQPTPSPGWVTVPAMSAPG